VPLRERKQGFLAKAPPMTRAQHAGRSQNQELDMHQIIYIVGLIVVILAILSFFGLR
jgi:hypothetical protein